MNAIEIYENADRKLNKSEITLGEYERMIDLLRNVIPIPEGATNGDIIKAMFPDCKDWKARLEENDGEVYEVHFVQLPNSLIVNKYEESWWNAKYKGVEK
jgi:hypothetical protein